MAKTGTWENPKQKKLPGIYIRFLAAASEYGGNLVGTIGMPVTANWGPINEVVTIKNSENELVKYFGKDENAKYTAYRLGKLLLKTKVKYLKLYRVADSSAAKSTINLKNTNGSSTDIIKLESKFPTSKELNVTIKNSIVDKKATEMHIYEGTKLLGRITGIKGTVDEMVDKINSSYDNQYIVATKIAESTDPLEEVSNKKLTGGNDGCTSIQNKNYMDAFAAFERENIQGFCLGGKEDEALDASAFAWIKKNEENGRIIQYFNGIGASQDISEAYTKASKINDKLYTLVASAGILDGVEYTPAETACYLCASEISNRLDECDCNKTTVFDSVKKVYSIEELRTAQDTGVLVLDVDEDNIVIVDDVNTYKKFKDDNENEKVFGYNRSVRIVSAINTMLIKAGKAVIGVVDNDREEGLGIDIVITGFKKGFEELVARKAIKNFEISVNEELQADAEPDELYVKWNVDTMFKIKKIYSDGVIR